MTGTRLVLDTNVLLSALLFSTESFSWLRRAWQSEAILPLASRDTTAELIRVLRYPKFRLTREERAGILADYLPWCETVVVSNPPDVPHYRGLHSPLHQRHRPRILRSYRMISLATAEP